MIHTYPLFRPFVFFVCGIAAGDFFFNAGYHTNPVAVLLSALLLAGLAAWFHFRITYRGRHFFGLLLPPLFLLFGWAAVQHRAALSLECGPDDAADGTFRAVIYESPVVRDRVVRVRVRLAESIRLPGSLPSCGRCQLHLERDAEAESLSYGEEILFHAALRSPPPPLNDGEFGYDRHLFRKGIVRQAYVPAGRWTSTGRHAGSGLMRMASGWHRRVFTLLRESGLDADTKGLVSVMLLGDDALLDPEVSAAYADAGVSHILCVSGMHVGILYMMSGYLLFFLGRSHRLRLCRSILQLLLIWAYACVVALAPSVVRASVMFSFVTLGGVLQRQTSVYNSLLTSAFLMLLLQPMLLFDIGFQLSYLAVWGIVAMQPVMQRWWSPRNRACRFLWGIWSVSISAQLFTTPVTLYCFHRFPSWFLLSNVAVVTAAPFVVGVALAYMLLSFQPFLSGCLAFILELLVRFMHGSVSAVGRLPFAVIGPVRMDAAQLVFSCMLVCMLVLFLKKRTARLGLAVLLCMSLLVGEGVRCAFRDRMHVEAVMYAVPHHYAVEYGTSDCPLLFSDSPEQFREGVFDRYMEGYRIRHGHSAPQCVERDSTAAGWVRRGDYFQLGRISFLFLQGRFTMDTAGMMSFSPDYLLVGDSLRARPEKVLSTLCPGCVCTLPGISRFRIGSWKSACMERGIPFVEMGKTGMLRLCIDKQ